MNNDVVVSSVLPLEVQNVSDFGFIDFMDETNFEQLIELIRGESIEPAARFCANLDCDHVIGCLPGDATQFDFAQNDDDLCDFNIASFSELNSFPEEINAEDEGKDDDESLGTTTTNDTSTPGKKRTKRPDRSRTLISERKRRGRMKEKLYALRALVPNITKMDKASIIGDAIRYVQDLQMKSNKLKAEVASLESSLNQTHQNHLQEISSQESRTTSSTTSINPPPAIKKIFQMEVFKVESREYYVRLVCNKRQGIAALLYKALDSLGLCVRSSNLGTAAENYFFTFTLTINEVEMDINLANLKLWIVTAFCDQGFDFVTLPSA
ncbi:OLC1v1003770C1 [Oldenlandia corymbosa var. corymbosa]|uniref:OLC1v1003770C1 n=1 Tax=Oldenlandia corymbosa var. corymbosa TaxID=529605 RepID=A0AAV1DAR8_OLDCO|nr:OLC1v1003770C1 [Oldenlandia corymbosa var. corymbosa]